MCKKGEKCCGKCKNKEKKEEKKLCQNCHWHWNKPSRCALYTTYVGRKNICSEWREK